MFEATGKTRYLDRALLYVNNMIADAALSSTISTSQFKDDFMAWPSGDGLEYALYESFPWRCVVSLLRLMKQNTDIYNNSIYRDHFDAILAFTETHIFEKWYSRGINNIYRSRAHMASHWARICLNLYVLTGNVAYREVFENFNNHLPNYTNADSSPASMRGQLMDNPSDNTAWFWSDVWGSFATPGQDVSHGNAVVSYIVESQEVGVEWDVDDISRLISTLDNIIWPADSHSEFVDGSGSVTPWYSDGFAALGRFSEPLQGRLATLAVEANDTQFYGVMAVNHKKLFGA